MTQNSPDAAHAVALMEAHTELTRIYDEVLQRLDDKSVEVEQMQETLQQREKEMQERVQSLQQRLETEQEDTDALRAKLSDLEDSHIQVLRSYRDMNDRLIRLRQMYEGQTVAVQQPKVAPTKPEKESRRREHARIRLRRPGGD
jgi:chromosome segregation ATPase